jgi:predicted transposase YbfD/YdcC
MSDATTISSLGLDAKRMAESVRGHWAIEHALHWVLGSAFREDDGRIRKGHAPKTSRCSGLLR